MKLTRLGKISISLNLIENHPEDILVLMGKMIILHCEQCVIEGVINYTAYSPAFREIRQGEVIPEYWCDVNKGYSDPMKPFQKYNVSFVERVQPETYEKGYSDGLAASNARIKTYLDVMSK